MKYKSILRALLAFLLFTSHAAAQQSSSRPGTIEAARLREHVTYLASDKLDGRRTGTNGARDAALYVAQQFGRLRLRPPVIPPEAAKFPKVIWLPEAYMQEFPYVSGVALGKGNALTATRRADAGTPMAIDFPIGEDWTPLGFSSNARVEGPVVFVGFGITAADQNYDDYKGLDVKDKVAFALSGTPDGDNPHSRFTRAGELRFKAAAARAAGARALVVIASEEKFTDDKLSRLRYDNTGGDAGLPVLVISRQAAAKILDLSGPAQLKEVEEKYPKWRAEATTPQGEQTRLREYDFLLESLKLPPHPLLNITTDIARTNAPASNVVGVFEGSDPKLKDEVIVIGAHYDHLGRGGEGSLAAREGDIHHGADDNASGVAGLLELARLFSQERERMRRTVVFVAFGGEEEGLIGSSFYVRNPSRPLAQTVAMINMDMIGRLKDGALSVGGVGTSDVWREWVSRANGMMNVKVKAGAMPTREGAPAPEARDPSGGATPSRMDNSLTVATGVDGRAVATVPPAERFSLRLNEDGYGPSDHSSFYSKQVPVLFFFTGAHEDYHKPTDTADRINYEGEARVLEFVREIVYDLQDAEKRPTFAVAKSDGATRRTGFNVSLGTIPSYADSTDGLKLDGVREGSPAAAAGLAAGDVIVKLAGRDVRNVYDYTQALSEMKAGQEYEVELMRGGQRLQLKIVPAARK